MEAPSKPYPRSKGGSMQELEAENFKKQLHRFGLANAYQIVEDIIVPIAKIHRVSLRLVAERYANKKAPYGTDQYQLYVALTRMSFQTPCSL